MSHLADHARAARIVAEAFSHDAALDDDPAVSGMLHAFAACYRLAADRMEAEARADIVGHACTIDHRAMVSTTCSACKDPRG
jgi:hypothetical protein